MNEDLVEVLRGVHKDLESALEDYGEDPDAGVAACVELGGRERQLRLVADETPREPKAQIGGSLGN